MRVLSPLPVSCCKWMKSHFSPFFTPAEKISPLVNEDSFCTSIQHKTFWDNGLIHATVEICGIHTRWIPFNPVGPIFDYLLSARTICYCHHIISGRKNFNIIRGRSALFKQKRKFMEVWHGKICVTASTAHGYGLFGFTLFVTTLLKNVHENQALNIEFW